MLASVLGLPLLCALVLADIPGTSGWRKYWACQTWNGGKIPLIVKLRSPSGSNSWSGIRYPRRGSMRLVPILTNFSKKYFYTWSILLHGNVMMDFMEEVKHWHVVMLKGQEASCKLFKFNNDRFLSTNFNHVFTFYSTSVDPHFAIHSLMYYLFKTCHFWWAKIHWWLIIDYCTQYSL